MQQLRTSVPLLMCTCLLLASVSAATTSGRAAPNITNIVMDDAVFGDCNPGPVSWLRSSESPFINLSYQFTGDADVATLTGTILTNNFDSDNSVSPPSDGFVHETESPLDEGEHLSLIHI